MGRVLPQAMAFQRTKVIRASPDRVFSVLTDTQHAKEWMPSIQRIEDVTPGPFGLGTSWQETRLAGKRTMQSTLRVSAFHPPGHLALEVDSKPMKGQISFALVPKEGGTEVRYEAQMWGKGLMRLMTGTINRMMAQEDSDILDRLEARVQGRQ
ncbi:MAG: SRPBCC family protein [Thermoplasmata archaeon]|nr:SRPBCC family protein [Thermoplasmata archaeon]